MVMQKLHLHEVSHVSLLTHPEQQEAITLESAATLFFTDFERVEPQVIDAATSADLARLLMLKAHVKLKLVVDQDNQFLGVISLDDISAQNITAHTGKETKRENILVADLMTPKHKIKAFDFNEIKRSNIESIIHALKDSGLQHCLVVDSDTQKIRGVFSASDISRKLGLPINIQQTSNFYKVFSSIAS